MMVLVLKNVTCLLIKLKKENLPADVLSEIDSVVHQITKAGDELIRELADHGHCKVFIECGQHDFAWDCRLKRGEPCPYNHVRGGKL